jgi:RHS repeat-associated protein
MELFGSVFSVWFEYYEEDLSGPVGSGGDSTTIVAESTYDAAGNLTSAPGMGSYTYDAENRMTATAGVSYTYDGDGRRVQKSSGKLYWYGMSGLDALLETDLAGNNPTEYVFFGGKRAARRDPGGSIFYYFSNHLGSASVITNSAGAIVEESDYYPFGGERIVVNTDPNPYKFTGKERDPESGLDFFIARYYSSAQGRFLSPDEFTGGPVDAFSSGDPLPPGPLPYADITNPQSLNKYTYTFNNPLRYTDPTGHGIETLWDVASLVQGVTSFVSNVSSGNYGAAALDAVGIVADAAAVATPFVPGGVGVALKGARAANKAADTLAANKKTGEAFEAVVKEVKKADGQDVVTQLTVKTDSGVKTRIDVGGTDANGTVSLTEAKSSATAPLTKNQKQAFPEIEKTGATVAGKGKGQLPGGTQIPPTKVQVVRPEDLKKN